MEINTCPKCNETMDEGLLNISRAGAGAAIGYVSQKQKGMLRPPTNIKVRACPNCGYVELYLDPKELKQRLT
jgi:predicted nucleic-acid-binding Zn-ribbon protein